MLSKIWEEGDFPGGPVVKTSLSSARGTDSISGQGAKIPHALGPKKTKNKTSNIVTNSIKTLKMVHIKRKIFNKNKI